MKKTKIEWCDCTINPVVGCKNGCPYPDCWGRKYEKGINLEGRGMKREILFKGFCPAVVDGKPHTGGINYFILANSEYVKFQVIPETVGQYTGLTDKNGKKIFEHDRVKYKCGVIVEVKFTEYGAFIGETESLFYESRGGVLTEVIGTIFDKEN